MLTLAADQAITEPGLYDLDGDIYHSDPTPTGSLSSTWARELMEPAGPARFHHARMVGQAPKKVFEFGHAAHGLVLGTGAPIARIPAEYLSSNGAAGTNDARDFIRESREAGAIPLKDAEADVVEAMALQIKRHREAMSVLTAPGAAYEVSAFRIDDRSGMWLRARFDVIAPSGLGDYKTVVDADPRLFGRRTAADLGYHQQDAWYLDTAVALDAVEPRTPFRFVLQEKKAPYLVSVVELDGVYRQLGRERNRRAIDLYAECRATDTWPGFTGTTVVEPPLWLIGDDADQLAQDIETELAAYAASLKQRN